jgi:hypothetical protein
VAFTQQPLPGLARSGRTAPLSVNDLSSEKGIDYTHLRDLLKAQKWREADQETWKVMRRAAGKTFGQRLSADDFRTFPCTDLHTIDRLWVTYSQGQFGFSVQKKIYVECGAKPDGKPTPGRAWTGYNFWTGYKFLYEFYQRVGWLKDGQYIRSYRGLRGNLSCSPKGEFPYSYILIVGGGLLFWWIPIFLAIMLLSICIVLVLNQIIVLGELGERILMVILLSLCSLFSSIPFGFVMQSRIMCLISLLYRIETCNL